MDARKVIERVLTHDTGALLNPAMDMKAAMQKYGRIFKSEFDVITAIRHSSRGSKCISKLIEEARAGAAATSTFEEFISAMCLHWTDSLRAGVVIVPDLLTLRRELQLKDAPKTKTKDGLHPREGFTLIQLLAELYASVKRGKTSSCGSDATVQFRKDGFECTLIQTKINGCSTVKHHDFPGCFLMRDLYKDEPIPPGCDVFDPESVWFDLASAEYTP